MPAKITAHTAYIYGYGQPYTCLCISCAVPEAQWLWLGVAWFGLLVWLIGVAYWCSLLVLLGVAWCSLLVWLGVAILLCSLVYSFPALLQLRAV